MSYHIYRTEALVLGSQERGEADRMLALLSREFGLITASARSIRANVSKLRYALQTFAHAECDLVRGRHGWKLTSVRPERSHAVIWRSAGKRRIAASQASLLRRLVAGEEAHASFYDDVFAGFRFLEAVPDDPECLRDTELLLVLRTLDALGYWGDRERAQELLAPVVYATSLLAHVRRDRSFLIERVNAALRETQL